MAPSPLDDENAPLYTVGQVAELLGLKQAFLRRVDQLQVVSPQRSEGGQRRYTRYEIQVIQQVVNMADQGITLQAIRRIIALERQLAQASRERDQLAGRLAEVTRERDQLARWLADRGNQPGSADRGNQPGSAGPP
jgi:MerR family transcriptional regulator, heat shock protein HspR